MLVAAAVCPETPLLVPSVAAGAAHETQDVRAAAVESVTALLRARPDVLIVVAGTPGQNTERAALAGSFRPFGVDLVVGAGDGDGPRPDQAAADGAEAAGPGLAVARWLVDSAAARGRGSNGDGVSDGDDDWTGDSDGVSVLAEAASRCEAWTVGTETDAAECAAFGARLAARDERIALLAIGDGSARRGEKAPGFVDPRAIPFDDAVGDALARADADALGALDPGLAAELLAAGRAAWQVLAGAVHADGRPWSGELLSYCAPYGVAYFAAVWAPAG